MTEKCNELSEDPQTGDKQCEKLETVQTSGQKAIQQYDNVAAL